MGHDPQPAHEPEYEPEDLNAPIDDDLSLAASLAPAPGTGSALIGQTLAGRYRFDELLGEGSFARVFKVYDLRRQVYLAAKVLRSDIAQEPAFLERFKREAVVLARLQHPNIVRYYETVESGDVVFILTDFIPDGPCKPEAERAAISPFEARISRPMAAAPLRASRRLFIAISSPRISCWMKQSRLCDRFWHRAHYRDPQHADGRYYCRHAAFYVARTDMI
jgi:hypothetical protein